MEYAEAFEIIQMKFRHSCRSDVIEGANVSGSTYDRWAWGEVHQPRLTTFVKFCIYFDISVDVTKLKELLV